ncbi:uncharacterized protein GGS22DRAFT_33714 [Annulohypoxylon maeteangense]|uniref:uncharacterized protein n=1 Tax=Annulohypoxylon maeteangense TaxID=1927788 RepID=UPI0020082ECB|nr:uncharacterized protein GGS22DRAFT_33714 [Annulohypoxylon maeteangense]KAI0883612.1 hypothetical protein GGS22DRAFT_33714 [Annulohypoxylon maeteangense]
MSVPPQLIRVKRKATEEAPVSFLRVQENKRHRSEAFVYQRKEEQAAFLDIPPNPHIHNYSRSSRSSRSRNKQSTTSSPSESLTLQVPSVPGTIASDKTIDDDINTESAADAASVRSTGSADLVSEPRRFHMSKRDMIRASSSLSGRSDGGISKKRSAPTLFVERKIKRISSKPVEKFQSFVNEVDQAITPTATVEIDMGNTEPRKRKKPGISKYLKKEDKRDEGKKPSDRYKADLPKSLTERWNVDMDMMTTEMNAFTMEQIGLNLQKAEEENKLRSSAKTQLKFKPKPVMRYAERHPEEAQDAVSADRKMVDSDVDVSDSGDSDYIIETYERVPASKIGEHVPAHKIGILVIEADPELDYFYGDDGDSEEEWAEDEEDENAENYYTADYPDEEVASDDEFNKNPYSFRTGNASDLEEYDLADEYDDDDATFSEKGEEGRFATYIGRPNREFATRNL